MFDLLGDMARGVGRLVGSVVALPVAVVAESLNLTTEMVEEAINAGCETYEEIRDYFE